MVPSTVAAHAEGPAAPKALTVSRAAGNPHDLAISWKPEAGVSNYMVRVNDGAKDTNVVVPADQTATVFHGQGDCTTYRVSVSAVVSPDSMATTGITFVPSLGPGGISSASATRNGSGTTGSLDWAPPKSQGADPVRRYSVLVKQLSNGRVIHDADQSQTTLTLKDLDPARMYAAKVTPLNSYGGCVTSTLLLGNERPSNPVFTVTRAVGQPASAVVNWKPSDWNGFGELTGYRIGYKSIGAKGYTWVSAKPSQRTATIPELDPTVNWTFVMRAVNRQADGLLSKPYVLRRSGYSPADPSVSVTGGSDTITVDFSSPVGSSNSYSSVKVNVARANGTAGWSDRHQVTNQAGQVVFKPVPCGTYAVVVAGVGAKSSKDLVRTEARVCDLPAICFISTLSNGGFESPALPNSSYKILPSSTAGLSWNNTAESFVELWSSGFQGVPAAQGRQFAELNANKAGTLYQDLPTTPGTSMRWYLMHRGRAGDDTMRVMIGRPGGQLSQSGRDLTTGKSAWVQYTGTYRIPAGQTTTRFAFQAVRTAASISVGNLMDDVVFTPESCQ